MLKIGVGITIEKFDGKRTTKCKSKIIDIDAGNHQAYIDYPIEIETGKTIFLSDKTDFTCTFTSQNQTYMFSSQIAGRKMHKIPMLVITLPAEKEFIKVQRREFVRVDTIIDVAVHSPTNSFPPFRTLTLDVSAGGMAIAVKNPYLLTKDTILDLYLALPSERGKEVTYIKVKGQVIRNAVEKENGALFVPIQFQNLTEFDRTVIMRYIFEQQLSERKKELLQSNS